MTDDGSLQSDGTVPKSSEIGNVEEQLRAANEEVYQHSRELSVKNRTLALLGKLYEVGTRDLQAAKMAEHITEDLQRELALEIAGIFLFDAERDTLTPLGIALSERLRAVWNTHRENGETVVIRSDSRMYQAAYMQQSQYTERLNDMCSGLISADVCHAIEQEGAIRSSLVYPLVSNGRTIGVLLVGMNRLFNDMAEYERQAIESCVNVIAIALYKVELYEQLTLTNTRLVELDRLKSEFVSLASHQMRAPLTSIKGFASLILEGDLGEVSDKVREAIEKIFASTNLMVRSVEDFLNVSRIEQGQMKYDFAPGNIAALAEEMVKRFKPVADQKNIALVFESRVDALNVSMDAYKIEQVLTNLIDNAIKYTLQGAVVVTVETHDTLARIRVKDSGVGMSREAIGKLFQRFARAEGAGKVNVAGTGLGLYVARQMIEAHHGIIWAESEGEGKGSTFIIELPLLTV